MPVEGISVAFAMLAIRMIAGILFFFQGYDKVFRLKPSGVVNAFSDILVQRKIPLAAAHFFVLVSSLIELAGGLLLVLGLFREPVLYILTANMIGVALGFSILRPLWDMSYYFPRFVLLMLLLLLPGEWDCFSLTALSN